MKERFELLGFNKIEEFRAKGLSSETVRAIAKERGKLNYLILFCFLFVARVMIISLFWTLENGLREPSVN